MTTLTPYVCSCAPTRIRTWSALLSAALLLQPAPACADDGGTFGQVVAPFLKQHNVPVLISSVMDLPSREDDPYDVNFSLPAKLAEAGVRYAIATGDGGAEARDLPYVAGMAASFGLPKDAALRAVTLAPAQIFGVDRDLGSIEEGKLADLKPSGQYVQEDLHSIGGTPAVMKYLLAEGLMTGDCLTVTGKTMGENLEADGRHLELSPAWHARDAGACPVHALHEERVVQRVAFGPRARHDGEVHTPRACADCAAQAGRAKGQWA